MMLVVFDCDGTLVDSQKTIVACMTRAFRAHGLKEPARDEVLGIVGLSLEPAVARLAPELDRAHVAAVALSYKNAFPALRSDPAYDEPLFPGCAGLLDTLAERDDIVLGIATGKSVRGVKHLLDRHGWHGRFATIQTADTNPSKPHPAMMQNALKETGVDSCSCLLVGDTSFDMEMARSAGCGAVGVSWGYHRPNMLRRAGAQHVIEDCEALLGLLATHAEVNG